MNPYLIIVGGNDEHGMNPPSPGKRSPVMPYLDRPIYENEFNRPTKERFLSACARIGFRTFDVHPELADTTINERVRRANRAGLSAVVTFAYNATIEPGFNPVRGAETYYSSLNVAATASMRLANGILNAIETLGVTRSLGAHNLDIGMLSSVNMPAALVEAGFMTNYQQAALMLDPQWQTMIAEAAARAVAEFFGAAYIAPEWNDCPTLARGASGPCVLWLQWLLTLGGVAVSLKDGNYGSLTESAVMLFQQENGLGVDGVAGAETWALLTTDFASAPPLSRGSRGVYVRYLQQKLLSKLYPIDAADGVFGAATENAVRDFQAEHALSVTGAVDERTWNAVTVFDAARPQP